MKKHYEKPLVAVEYYELTQTIASCSLKIGFLDRMCVLKDDDATAEMRNMAATGYFNAGKNGCTKYTNIGDNYDGICYHTNLNAAFNS